MNARPGPTCLRSSPLVFTLAALALAALAGCMSVRDRRFNAYSPGNGDPTVIERAQHVVDDAAETLDTFDTWQENYIY